MNRTKPVIGFLYLIPHSRGTSGIHISHDWPIAPATNNPGAM
jgi:hypothetical protein